MSKPALPRLLLIEDDALVRETIALMLEDAFDVTSVETAASALAMLQDVDNQQPNILLLDCLLPEGKLDLLLAEADLRGIPVVLTSGDPRQAELQPGARPFLRKPFSRTAALDTLTKALG